MVSSIVLGKLRSGSFFAAPQGYYARGNAEFMSWMNGTADGTNLVDPRLEIIVHLPTRNAYNGGNPPRRRDPRPASWGRPATHDPIPVLVTQPSRDDQPSLIQIEMRVRHKSEDEVEEGS